MPTAAQVAQAAWVVKVPDENQKFADEAVEHRESRGSKTNKKIERREHGHRRREAAELANQKRVAAIVEHADDEKESAGGDAVAEHLKHRAVNRRRLKREIFPARQSRGG